MLKLNNIEVVYSDVILVLRGASLDVPDGRIIALLGANGAGKTTTLRAISGLLHAQEGKVTRGSVEFDGQRLDRLPPEDIVQRGIIQVLEGHRLFRYLTVEENLLIGAQAPGAAARGASIRRDVEQVYQYFPRLQRLRRRTSGYLSGGEQQMLVIGRALMAHPKIMLLDEPSLGLAPLIVSEIFHVIKQISTSENMAIVLVEQNAHMAGRCRSRLRDGEWARGVGWSGGATGAKRRHQRILSGSDSTRRAQELSRSQTLQAAQTLVGMKGKDPKGLRNPSGLDEGAENKLWDCGILIFTINYGTTR